MPTNTYTPIASVTLSATASEVVFSGLPQTFRDLILVVDGTGTGTMTFGVQFNGDTASNYSYVEMTGDTTANSSAGSLSQALVGRFTTTQSVSIGQVMDYAQTNKHKTVLARGGPANELVRASASRWANTAAVTAIRVVPLSNSFASGTTMSIYGVIA
jgi:hypothetical protein